MVKYLAELTGNNFVRINNHDSTEVQEYLGHYVTDEFGKLRFVDGILVSAVRHGSWVVLDELNLAPTDVLEALNRLLDDNCELFIPDTQETIKPHPQLRIFATQNPAGVYGGRKMLSRAFRNRFLEITVDEIPTDEISTILKCRYSLPESFAEKMVDVMTSLQVRRQNSQIFAGKHGFITPRDLFRWAERKPSTYQELAEHGFLLLGERCRKPTERQVVKDIIESATKTEINEKELYLPSHWPFVDKYFRAIEEGIIDDYKIVWTDSMQRLFTIVGICLERQEPVLLVGETGSSKTTVCQLWAALLKLPLHILNCHQHTEAADFLGSLRPAPPDRRDQALFEWRHGPLVHSMLEGHFFVLDEISLTEDSVLERLNSVLEPLRSITLAEKSTSDCIVAHENFRVMATMNPGGDFGKKELSPALRNRFTEIYVRPTTSQEEVTLILSKRLKPELSEWASRMARVLCQVSEVVASSVAPQHISIRDVISWVEFMNAANGKCLPSVAFMQGLEAVILDGIGVGTGQSEASCDLLKRASVTMAESICPESKDISQGPFWTLFAGMEEPQLPEEMQRRFFFGAPATQRNLSKLMRASIARKAVLLEGSPGVGKTSIVEALGCAMRCPVVRINLSDQTDIMDLFGTFLPCPTEEASGPQFAWSDGVLLRALKEGSWVILDELNLASQTVLEGLNALLDHRSTVFIPELNQEFAAHSQFRVFACQNPLVEGGGRKGLPRSFLNRFMRVRIEAFEVEDLICIAKAVCPDIEEDLLKAMIAFVGELQQETMVRRTFGFRGGPWEFNLRDVLRWANFMQLYDERRNPSYFADMLFLQRMRTDEDKNQCLMLLERFCGPASIKDGCNSDFLISDAGVYFENRRLITRGPLLPSEGSTALNSRLMLLPSQSAVVRSLLMCAAQNQFALLVGASGAGKTFALRMAASLAGVKLVTFSMTASCDTVDLLGGFDQVEGKQGQFEWRDSLVLEAMTQGHWLVLDNVNYCNASVLDRLNPLVEPNGILSVNEQGLVHNQIRVIRPHPGFRVFATVNPKFGEISRAMRNRAVEVYVTPIAIPSVESIALSGHACGCHREQVMSKLAAYHQRFVQEAFHADPSRPLMAQLPDALASGAPNLFTLLRTASMLGPSASVADLERAVLHRYLDNRSGHWRYMKEELLAMLTEILQDPFAASTRAAVVADSIAAMQLHASASGEEEACPSLALSLARCRVARLSLALRKLTALSSQVETPAERLPSLLDVALLFVLDQCSDSTPLAEVALLRREALLQCVPNSSHAAVHSLVDAKYAMPGMLPHLYCRATITFGPHAHRLALLPMMRLQVSDSTLVNSCVGQVLEAVQRCLEHAMVPDVLQHLLGGVVPFLRELSTRTAIDAENYVSLATRAIVLRDTAQQLPSLGGASELMSTLHGFLTTLRRYLDLPFPLMGGQSVLYDCVAHPHITTEEERETFQKWQAAAAAIEQRQSEKPSTAMVRLLWECAAFRAEFTATQRMLTLLSLDYGEGVASVEEQLSMLQSSVRRFLDRYTKQLPLFGDLEMTMWRGILHVSAADAVEVLGQYSPLLVSRFASRYGVSGVQHLFAGSWARAANACLQHASQVSVLAIGSTENDFASTLSGLSTFLTACPVTSWRPFREWQGNARRELLRILRCCFPEMQPLAVGSCSSEVPSASLLEAVDSLVSSAPASHALGDHLHLLQKIITLLADEDTNLFAVITLLWVLKCRLLLPRSPIDPMYKRGCVMEAATEELELMDRLQFAFTWAETVTMRTTTAATDILDRLHERERERLAMVRAEFVQRPDRTGAVYANLVRHLYQFCTTLLSNARMDSIAAAAVFAASATESLETLAAVGAWGELIFQQVVELLDRYGGYEDVTMNIAEAALLAAMASQACCHASPRPRADRTLLDLPDTLRLLQYPHCLVGPLPLPLEGDDPPMQHTLDYLDACLTMLRGSVAQAADRDFVEGVFAAYRDLYRRVEQLEERERHDAEMSVLYKEKALVIEGDDERLLRSLKDLFPSYEKEFADEDEGADDADDNTVSERREAKAAKHTRIMLKERDGAYVRRLVATHGDFYARLVSSALETSNSHPDEIRNAFTARFDVLSSELPRFAQQCVGRDTDEHEERLLLNGFASRAVVMEHAMRGGTPATLAEKQGGGFNVFTDADSQELSRFSKPLTQLLTAVEDLSATYPDTVALQRCLRVGRKIAALPALSTPLMKVMTGCEILLRECYEWERNASHHVSLMSHMTELSSFVLRWRRLELHCWSHVFKAKKDEFELRAALQWFHFYDLIHQADANAADGAALSERCTKLFQTLSQFMWGACYGDYFVRLRLIRNMGYELTASMGYASPLANVALHVADFFSQFEALLQEKVQNSILPIEDDIHEFTKIMRWEDANYYAVRATSEKAHLKMARVLGSLEDALRTPVHPVIAAEEQRCEDDPSMGIILPSSAFDDDTAAGTKGKRKAAGKAQRGAVPLREKSAKRRRGGKEIAVPAGPLCADGCLPWSCTALADAQQFFEDSYSQVVQRVAALQAPKTPGQMKIRALKHFFDTMTATGVPHTHENQVSHWEVLFSSTEALLGCRSVNGNQPVAAQVSGASQEYYRFARWVQRMREADRAKPNPDLSGAQVRRGTGLAETLFADAVQMGQLVCGLSNLHKELDTLHALLDGCSPVADKPAGVALLDGSLQLCCTMQNLYDSFTWMLHHQFTLPEVSGDRVMILELGQHCQELWRLCIVYEPLRRAGAPLPAAAARKILSAVRRLDGACGRLQRGENPTIAAAAAVHRRQTADVLGAHDTADVDGEPIKKRSRPEEAARWSHRIGELLQDIAEKFTDDSILVSSPVATAEPAAGEEELPSVYSKYRGKVAALVESTESSAAAVWSAVQAAESHCAVTAERRNELLLQVHSSIITIRGVQQTLVSTMRAHNTFGMVIARLFTILIKKGFCKPEDQEEEEQEGEGDGGQQNGTGMDDGEGEKDVTNEIENEDQLMNMKDKEEQPEPPKDGEKEEGEEDNAADVETDFQAQKQEREESDQEGDEEGEESDKEMGSVDGDNEQDRKKMRKEKGDNEDMSEDDGDAADEVPDDEFGQEPISDGEDETGGFDNKEKEIRDAEQQREGDDHDMVGDDEKDAISDDGADNSDDDDGDTVDRSDDEGEEKEMSEVDSQLDANDDDQEEGSSGAEDREDDDASTDFDRSTHGERELENEENGELSGSDVEDACDAKDENVFEGGIQDDQTGEEATERQDKDRHSSDQPDTGGNEEEQAGDEQEHDEDGRSWKKQQQENQNAQRKDNTEKTRAQHNPYRAVKEALQRHQQQVQQLNLNRHVEVQDDKKMQDDKDAPPQNPQEDVEDFDFDEQGDHEGMAATDERVQKPTEAEQELPDPSEDEEAVTEDEFEENAEAPQDTRNKRKKQADEINEVEQKEGGTKKASKNKKVKVTAPKDEDNLEEDLEDAVETPEEELVDDKVQRGRRLWQEQESAVQGLSQQLCEQLRLILAPTLADRLQGDYKTGKRLNMKRIIPYIASQFKKDRIWLRRTKPNKRTYQIMVALDDSLSMQCNDAGVISCRAVALIAKALQQLEVGEIGIACFGKDTQIVHGLEDPFLADSGSRAFSEITFAQKSTNMRLFLETTLSYLDEARERVHGQTRSTTQQLQQVMFIISDGQITEDRTELRKLLVRAEENHQMVVFVLLDLKANPQAEAALATDTLATAASGPAVAAPLSAKDLRGLTTAERMRRLKVDRDSRLKRVQSNSILDMQIVEFNKGKVVRRPYMTDFPFPYYLIVRELHTLPEIIADAMRQWFELLNAAN